jgi:DNA polymerase-3 subunit alpha
LTELVPFNAVNPVTLSQAINDVPELRDASKGLGLYNLHGEGELIKQVLSTALVLEGLHRHSSTHAAGVVIANEDMILTVPVCKDSTTNMLIVQYSMKYCELAGLIKFDFLGLQTLTVITKCLDILKSEKIDIDISKIRYDDPKTYEMLANGMSAGVFQFESAGMKSALRRLKPDSIEDIIALGALYRPGPMENIPTYIACKHGEQEADYLHPLLAPILKSTYGVIIYQEQVMEIARRLAGYSLGAADLLRKAMGKKVKAEMDAQEEIFASGAKANGVAVSQAKAIFDKVAKFAGYGFNKAHASAYGVISYQTAYLKANYTAEFLVASLNLEIDNSDKINLFLQEAKNFGIAIAPPCINRSAGFFRIENNEQTNTKSIIFAIGAIKNVTVNFGLEVESERKRGGLFKSVIDFMERIPAKIINRRLLENIIKAGCFDSVYPNRNSLLESVPKLMSYGTSFHAEKTSNQFSLIAVNSNSKDVLANTEDLSLSQKAFGEFDVMGLFMDNHPLSEFHDIFQQSDIVDSRYLHDGLTQGSSQIKIAGIIVKKDARMSQRGRFVTLVLSDPYGIFEVSIFSEEVLKSYSNLINVRSPVVVTCDAFKDQGGVRITAKSFISPECVLKDANFELKLYPQDASELRNVIEILKQKLKMVEY